MTRIDVAVMLPCVTFCFVSKVVLHRNDYGDVEGGGELQWLVAVAERTVVPS